MCKIKRIYNSSDSNFIELKLHEKDQRIDLFFNGRPGISFLFSTRSSKLFQKVNAKGGKVLIGKENVIEFRLSGDDKKIYISLFDGDKVKRLEYKEYSNLFLFHFKDEIAKELWNLIPN